MCSGRTGREELLGSRDVADRHIPKSTGHQGRVRLDVAATEARVASADTFAAATPSASTDEMLEEFAKKRPERSEKLVRVLASSPEC